MNTPTAAPALPTLLRQGISWRVAGDQLVVDLDFRNASDEPTTEEDLIIEAAPLGAFIPGRPVARRTLAGFDPGERRRESIEVPLRDVEFAVEDNPNRQGVAFGGFVPDTEKTFQNQLERWSAAVRKSMLSRITRKYLAHCRAHGLPLWGVNLNVYFDRAPESAVERHLAAFTKVEAGSRGSLGFYVLDSGDEYGVEARASAPGWTVATSDHVGCDAITVIAPGWVGARAVIEALVTRESDGRTVPVEFELQTVTREEFEASLLYGRA